MKFDKKAFQYHGGYLNKEMIMTVEQIRDALTMMESNYSMAMDINDYTLADALLDKIIVLQDQLVEAITDADPYTTEADARYFEGI